MNAERPSFFQRIRHFLAWDGWIVRRELPEGFRLRRYVAWNMVGVLCGIGLLYVAMRLMMSAFSADVVVCLLEPYKDLNDAISGLFDTDGNHAMRTDYGLAPCWIFLGGGLGCAALWLLLHCGSRAFFVRRNSPTDNSFLLVDAGRFLAGIVRPVLLLWALYIVATPIRPLDLHLVPPTAIPDWLKDENGEIARRREFLVADGEVPGWYSSAWSNLIQRLGEPLPPQIRLAFEMRVPSRYPRDRPLGEDANHRLTEVFWESRTNLVSLSAFPSELREDVRDWMDVCGKRLSRYAQCTGPQIWGFVATNSSWSAIRRSFDGPLPPEFREDISHAKADLIFSADSGSAKQFLDAAKRADIFRSTCQRAEDEVIFQLVAKLVSSIKVDGVLRFCERTDVGGDAFSEVRKENGRFSPSSLAQSTARTICLDGRLTPALEKPVYEELGLFFWRNPKPISFYSKPYSKSPGVFLRRVGALTMLATGCDFHGFVAGEESIRAYQAVWFSSLIDPRADREEDREQAFAQYDDSSFLRKFWRRGGVTRASWRKHFVCLFYPTPIVKALFADAYPAVEDAALLLAQFRAEEGRDAESLEEAAAKVGTEVFDPGSAFVELRYERIAPPEGAVEGTSAYALALVPKKTAPEWFRSEDRVAAWVVVRNPSFPGTRSSRLYGLDIPTGSDPSPEKETLAAAEGAPGAESARLAIPAALFGSDAEAIAAAERTMEDDRWQLR